MRINELTSKNIETLSDIELTELLRKLIRFEAEKFQMPNYNFFVPDKITRGDGGEDGGITCNDTKGSIWITNVNTIFQNKAKNLTPKECETELVRKTLLGKKLKKQIEKVLDAGGKYVLFMRSHPGSKQDLDDRIDKMHEACTKLKKSYNKNQFDVFDSRKIADWANNFIEAIIWVQEKCGITRISGLLSINEWAKYPVVSEQPFFSNAKLDEIKNGIKEAVKNKNACIRIIGHSGLGKTRIAYEALKEIENAQQSIVYYTVESENDNIIQFIKSNISNLSGILVIDNCDITLHERLKQEIKRADSNFKLITIDYNVEEEFGYSSKSSDTTYFFLNNVMYSDVIHNILQHAFASKLDDKQIRQIADYSEGYPIMAVYFAQARFDGLKDFSEALNTEIKERLVFGRDYSNQHLYQEKYRIIKACSIFKEFGFPFSDIKSLYGDDVLNKQIAQSQFIFTTVCSPGVSPNMFKDACEYFKHKGILERRGLKYSVRPNPLAIKLAVEWWQSIFDPNSIKTLLPEFEKYELAIPFVERLKFLSQLSEAKAIVNDYWGPNMVFSTAEVLNTELGSRLFRSVVEVNSVATVSALAKNYLDKPKEYLLKVDTGRRNLVWALEKLCFRQTTFEIAAKILMNFAVAENENIGNNATGQFLQLFHIYLAGTEASLSERLLIVDYALGKEDDDYTKLSILALGRAIRDKHYTRMVGAEHQGSEKPLKDYHPSIKEIREYRVSGTKKLLQILKTNPEYIELVKEQFVGSIRLLILSGDIDIVQDFIASIQKYSDEVWKDALSTLKRTLKRDKLQPEIIEKIESVIADLLPKDFKNKLKFTISSPVWEHEEDGKGGYIDINEKNAIALGAEISKNPEELIPHLRMIQEGEQRLTYSFGKALGENISDYKILIDSTLQVLTEIEKGKQNAAFLASFLSSSETSLKQEILQKIMLDDKLNYLSFYLTKIWLPDFKTINSLFSLVDSGKVDVGHFNNFLYGRVFDNLNLTEIADICQKIYQYGDLGKKIALSLMYEYSYNNNERWEETKDLLKKFIDGHNYLLNKENVRHDDYVWNDIVEKILNFSDNEFAENISKQLYEVLKTPNLYSYDVYLRNLCRLLIENYFSIFFDVISEALLSSGIEFLNLKFLLGSDFGDGTDKGILFTNEAGNKIIFEFCKKHKDIAAKRVAYMMPLYTQINGEPAFHEFALKMLDEFCSIEGFMSEFGANMGSFGITGSAIPFYKMQFKLVSELKEHKNHIVRDWAKKKIDYLEKTIQREKIEEYEWFS